MKKFIFIPFALGGAILLMTYVYSFGFERFLETAVATFAGGGAVVFIDWSVKCYLHKKRSFQNAIGIQMKLNHMLSISLQIRDSINMVKENYIKFNTTESWFKVRHVKIRQWKSTFDVINSHWDFTQFLSTEEDKVLVVLKQLIKTKFGFESLMFLINERNNLHEQVLLEIESKEAEKLLVNQEAID